jgi:hypothetical protein
MLQRAAKYPAVMVMLQHFILNEVLLLMLDSENRGLKDGGNFDQYEAACHWSTLLFSVTNCHKYVQMGLAERVRWASASEAQRKFHEAFVWIAKTKHGTNMFRDRWMETTVMYSRSLLGHRMYKGKHHEINRVYRMLPTLMQVKHGDTTSKCTGDPAREIFFSEVTMAVLRFGEKTNWAGPGPPTTVGGGEMQGGQMVGFSGKDISPALVRLFPIAEGRVHECWDDAVGSDEPTAKTDYKPQKKRHWARVEATQLAAAEREVFENLRLGTTNAITINQYKHPETKEKLFDKAGVQDELVARRLGAVSVASTNIPSSILNSSVRESSKSKSELSTLLAAARVADFKVEAAPTHQPLPGPTAENISASFGHAAFNPTDPRHAGHRKRVTVASVLTSTGAHGGGEATKETIDPAELPGFALASGIAAGFIHDGRRNGA